MVKAFQESNPWFLYSLGIIFNYFVLGFFFLIILGLKCNGNSGCIRGRNHLSSYLLLGTNALKYLSDLSASRQQGASAPTAGRG